MLRIWLFGELRIEFDGRPLERISSRRARSLLAWLALHRGLHPRSRVASLFWPDVLEESARMSLRTTLSTLRRECAPAAAFVAPTRDRVGIEDREDLWIDAREVDGLVADGIPEEALGLQRRGELLADLDDDWVLEARNVHPRRLCDLLGMLAAATDVATFPQWTAGDDVVLEEGRPLRVNGDQGFDPDDLEEYGAAVAALERVAASIPLDRPWAASEASALDAMTLDQELERPGAHTMLATTVANIFAAEPASLSLLHVPSTSAPAAVGTRS
jgi:hypothetical protein